jgi:cobalt-zinc-cadmium efflux system membrane fusion protein
MKYLHIAAFTASVFIIGCSSKAEKETNNTTVLSDSLIRSLTTAPVMAGEETDIVKLNGKIQANESKLVNVYALVSGKVQSLNAELGDYVHKGQILATVKSSEVAGTNNDMSIAESNLEMAKKAMESTKELYESNLATQQDYINASITYQKSLSELNRVKQVAAIAGGSNATYSISAPISGYIIDKNITAGSSIRTDNSNNLFSIADLSDVWIMANVYEADMQRIHLNDQVIVNTLARPEKDYTGRIDKIYNVLDPATRTMKVRISMKNPDNDLKPEMFATIRVTGLRSERRNYIPTQAVVMDNSRNYVIVKKGNKLEVREIGIIKRIEDKVFVTGLETGEQVITSSELFLYQALTSK